MDYKQILNEIKPSKEESREILKTSDKLISYLNEVCKDEGITASASLVGSVAKKTYLSGKSDIDVFISFPLDMDIAQLKKTGLYFLSYTQITQQRLQAHASCLSMSHRRAPHCHYRKSVLFSRQHPDQRSRNRPPTGDQKGAHRRGQNGLNPESDAPWDALPSRDQTPWWPGIF